MNIEFNEYTVSHKTHKCSEWRLGIKVRP